MEQPFIGLLSSNRALDWGRELGESSEGAQPSPTLLWQTSGAAMSQGGSKQHHALACVAVRPPAGGQMGLGHLAAWGSQSAVNAFEDRVLMG